MHVRRGELYWAFVAETGPHPVIVVSREDLNQGDYLSVVSLTSAKLPTRRRLPNCVALRAGRHGLSEGLCGSGGFYDPAPQIIPRLGPRTDRFAR